jgi:hypothetical protein
MGAAQLVETVMKKLVIIGMVLAVTLGAGAQAQDLTPEQINELARIDEGFSEQANAFEGRLQNKLTELAIELQREGRLDSEKSAAAASDTVNKIMKEIGELYGEFIKTKVQFVLEAKNVLTDEQKLHLLSQLEPVDTLPYDTIAYLQPETFELPLNLSIEQEKKLIGLEAKLLVKEIELERDVEFIMLDLEQLLLSGEAQPETFDPLIMKLAELAGHSINNRVHYFLKAKDVLTLDQKRLLAHMMGLD